MIFVLGKGYLYSHKEYLSFAIEIICTNIHDFILSVIFELPTFVKLLIK